MDKRIPARALIECILCARCNSYATATGGGICAACALTAERDQLRAEVERLRVELEDALKASGANAKAWQDCVEESAIKRTHLMAEISLTEQLAEAAESTAAGLRRALEVIDKELNTIAEGKLEEAKNDRTSAEAYGFGYAADHASKIVYAALSSTSDEHERRIKAEALADIMRKICAVAVQAEERESRTFSWSEAATIIHDEADRLEAANGQ